MGKRYTAFTKYMGGIDPTRARTVLTKVELNLSFVRTDLIKNEEGQPGGSMALALVATTDTDCPEDDERSVALILTYASLEFLTERFVGTLGLFQSDEGLASVMLAEDEWEDVAMPVEITSVDGPFTPRIKIVGDLGALGGDDDEGAQ